MYGKTALLFAPLAAAVPALVERQYPGNSLWTPDYEIPVETNAVPVVAEGTPTNFPTASQVPAVQTDAPVPEAPVRSSQVTGPTSHGPYTGPYTTTTGALQASTTLAASVTALPPGPDAFDYPSDGELHLPMPAPYTPGGGLGTNGSAPVYNARSDFDYESLTLALYQEWIELDLFHKGLVDFDEEAFAAVGLGAEDRHLLEFMANQEVGHSTLLSNILGPAAPPQCTYNYPYRNLREYLDFNMKLTRVGESGVFGFIEHLDSRDAAQMLLQSISTESRQQYTFRQMMGLFPMPVWFEVGIPQSWGWTLLAPYISSCPANTTRLAWQNFPGLHILNQPNANRWAANDTLPNETVGWAGAAPSDADLDEDETCVGLNITGYDCSAAISTNRTQPLSFPGRIVNMTYEDPGYPVGPNGSYVTSTSAGAPLYVLWVNQLNATYTDFVETAPNTGYTIQPNLTTYAGDPAVNGTMFIALTDRNITLTPSNISMINPFVRAGPALYQAG